MSKNGLLISILQMKNEKARQLELLRLKRAQLRVKKNHDLDAAAVVFNKANAKNLKLVCYSWKV